MSVFSLKSRERVYGLTFKAAGTVQVKQMLHQPNFPLNTTQDSQSFKPLNKIR